MNTVEFTFRKILAGQNRKVSAEEIDIAKSLQEYGIDSLYLAELLVIVQRTFNIYIADREWIKIPTIKDAIDLVEQLVNQDPPDTPISQPGQPNILYDNVEIGMPFTGLNNLSENALLKHVGDLRWKHVERLTGIPSKELVDSEGNRLYPTFFYTEITFPEQRPMASYGENDRIKFACSMKRFGRHLLDGITYLLPPAHSETAQSPYNGTEPALAVGIPSIRLSNAFVMQYSGAEWLRKSAPASPRFLRVPEMAIPPDSYEMIKRAEADSRFAGPPEAYQSMTDGPCVIEYKLVPDRDLNGAGLVYFANFGLFADIAERDVLREAKLSLTDELIDRRTVVRKRIAYLNNASSRDTLLISVEPHVEIPSAIAPEAAPIRLFINCAIRRKSDQRLMMISTAEKIVFGKAFEEVPFFDAVMASRSLAQTIAV